MRRKTGVLTVLTAALLGIATPTASALSLAECKQLATNNATIYLKWKATNYNTDGVTYTITRTGDGTTTQLTSGLARLEYFDVTVKPGVSYYYTITDSDGASITTGTVDVNTRNTTAPVYNIATEYEVSFDELLKNGYSGEGYKAVNAFSDNSFRNKDPRISGQVDFNACTDNMSHKFLGRIKEYQENWDKNAYPEVQNAKMGVGYTDALDTWNNMKTEYMTSTHRTNAANNFFLDGNRYLFIGNAVSGKDQVGYSASTDEETGNITEIPNFHVAKDRADGIDDYLAGYGSYKAKGTRATERYMWAAVGKSWRATGTSSAARKRERCWYISVREWNWKNGVLCIWMPDQYAGKNHSGRPYSGQPFFMDYEKFYYDKDYQDKVDSDHANSWITKQNIKGGAHQVNDIPDYRNMFQYTESGWGTGTSHGSEGEFGRIGWLGNRPVGRRSMYGTAAERCDGSKNHYSHYSQDNHYGIAFSENGQSFIHRTGSDYRRKPRWFLTHYIGTDGSRHDYKPNRNNSTIFQMQGSEGYLPGGTGAKDGYTHTDQVNISRCDLISVKGNLTSKDLGAGEQNYAWLWQVTDYITANNQVIIRGDRVQDGKSSADADKIRRIRLQGFQAAGFGGGDGFQGIQNYVITMPGNDQNDIFLKLNHNESGKFSLVYLTNDQINAPANNSTLTYQVAGENKDVVTFDLGDQYTNIAGGCSFSFNGETYLVLPATRQGNLNMGDFTIFRVKNRNTANCTLEPVANYVSPAIKDKQWSSRAGKENNAHRTMIQASMPYKSTDYVELFLYLPGRTLNMYSFYGEKVADMQPKVHVRPHIVHDQSNIDTYQNITHYEVKNNSTTSITPNSSYDHLKEFKTDVEWEMVNPKGSWSGSAEKYTDILLNTAAHQLARQQKGNSYVDNLSNTVVTNNGTNTSQVTYWNYDGTYQTEMTVKSRTEHKRKNNGKEETLYGNELTGASTLTYEPAQPNMTVQVFYDNNTRSGARQRVAPKTLYRVDISFNPVTTTAKNTNTENGVPTASETFNNIPVTRYEITRAQKGYNGLLDDDFPTAYVFTDDAHKVSHFMYTEQFEGGGSADRWMELPYANVKEQTIDGSTSVVIPGNYPFNTWKRHALPAMNYGTAEDGAQPAVLSFLTYDSTAKDDTYRIRAIYGTDNWNGDSDGVKNTKQGVSSYADYYTKPSAYISTGVDDIATEGVEETDVEYFNLQGVRVDAENLTPGMYIRHSSLGTRKVVVQ